MGPDRLDVTVLGCWGSYPGPDGACSGYLVEGGGVRVWLDAGNGTMANLQRHCALDDVDAVVLTHEHPDHWVDLEGFAVWAKYGAEKEGVPVYGPDGFDTITPRAELAPNLVWHVVADGDSVAIGGLRLTFSRTDHGPETLAVRVDGGGRSLGYSADTGPGWSFEALGPGLDLALCEATLLRDMEGEVPGHLSARQAGLTARAAGAGRLVLTHLWPTTDPAAAAVEGTEAFGEPVSVARLHGRYEV